MSQNPQASDGFEMYWKYSNCKKTGLKHPHYESRYGSEYLDAISNERRRLQFSEYNLLRKVLGLPKISVAKVIVDSIYRSRSSFESLPQTSFTFQMALTYNGQLGNCYLLPRSSQKC
jgi:hypothetical protein